MKGTYVIAIALLASCTVITADEDLGQEQAVSMNSYNIPTTCPFYEWEKTTNLPHETDCTKFYKCFLGKPILQHCPPYTYHPTAKLHYNRFEQVCDWPWRAGCSHCPDHNRKDGVRYPRLSSRISNAENCESYWECPVQGSPQLQYCQSGTCFSRTCQKCVKNRSGGYCDFREDGCINGQKNAHHCNCQMYYECIDNNWIVKSCDSGFHFNSRLQKCTTADQAFCAHNPFAQSIIKNE